MSLRNLRMPSLADKLEAEAEALKTELAVVEGSVKRAKKESKKKITKADN